MTGASQDTPRDTGAASVPLSLRVLRATLRATTRISPELAGRWVNRLWFRSRRYPEPAREREWLRSARWITLRHRGRALAVYRWGAGPTVLLLHGWHGRGAQLGGFAVALADAGFSAVAIDAPAHGRTRGRRTDVPDVAAALQTAADAFGPIHGLIAHSFGVPCALYALAHDLRIGRMVALSAPSDFDFLIDSFAATLGLSDSVVRVHRRLLDGRFGAEFWRRYAPAALARSLHPPALLLHDADDAEVPWTEGERLARAWSGARVERTRGLGHRRILRDPGVIARAVAFLAAAGDAPWVETNAQ